MSFRVMGRTRAAIVVAACVGLFLPPADGASNRFTLSGDGAGFVDITLGEGNKFDLSRATFKGGKSYLGIVFTRLGAPQNEDSVLAVRFPAADVHSPPRTVVLGHEQFGAEGTPLTAGTYRVYLLADGPASVSVPASKLRRDVTLRVTRRTKPRLRLADVATPLAPGVNGLYEGSARHPFTLDGQAMVITRLAAQFAGAPVTRQGAELCDTEQGGTCSGPTGGGNLIQRHEDEEVEKWVITAYVPRDLWPAGTYDVYGACYSLNPVPVCRLATLDRFVSTAPAQVALRIPQTAGATATATATPRPGQGAPAPRGSGGPLASSGMPGTVAALAAVLLTAALGAGRRRRA